PSAFTRVIAEQSGYFLADSIAAFKRNQIGALPTKAFGALKNLVNLSVDTIPGITPLQIPLISNTTLWEMSCQQLLAFTTEQLPYLTLDQFQIFLDRS